jgi:N-terminal acetyltransferase B complex non-catalytic subunit
MQNQLLSPPRAIQTAEELLLLIKIFESQGRYAEAVHILDSKNLGIKSRIAQNDWSFVRAKLLSLERAGKWNESLEFVRTMLTLPEDDAAARVTIQERDDWAVWSLMVLATEKIGDPE